MSTTDGQPVTAAVLNAAYVSRTVDTSINGKLGMNHSGSTALTDPQKDINDIFTAVGMTGENDATATTYSSNNVITNGDSRKSAIGKLDAEFNASTGHSHSGSAGEGPQINASNLSNINNYWSAFQSVTKTSASGTSVDVTTEMSGRSSGGNSTTAGVITSAPNNLAHIVSSSTQTFIEDAGGQRVYGRITESAGTWTLSFYTNEAGVETAHNLSSQDIKIIFLEVFTQATRPTIPSNPFEFGTLDVTADVIDASASARGLVSTGTQTFAGNKTFNGSISSLSTITGSNLSGTNTGDWSIGAVGSTPNVNGMSLSGATLSLQPANATYPGVVTADEQYFAGWKHFSGMVNFNNQVLLYADNNSQSGSGITLTAPTNPVCRLTHASLSSISYVSGSQAKQFFLLVNATGNNITINNEAGANGITTGTGSALTLQNKASVIIWYDDTSSLHRIIGGSGSGGGSTLTVYGSRGTPRSIAAATGIVSGSSHMSTTDVDQLIFVEGATSGVVEDITSNPQISNHTVLGAKMRIVGRNNDKPLKLDNGTGLEINGSVILNAGDVIDLQWDGTVWFEVGRNV